jgi:hypothetical protein
MSLNERTPNCWNESKLKDSVIINAGHVILSEAKNLGSFLDGSHESKSEMFRFAQYDSDV